MKSYRIKIMSVFIAFIDHCDLIFLETAKKAFNNQIMIKETFGTLDCGTGLPQTPQNWTNVSLDTSPSSARTGSCSVFSVHSGCMQQSGDQSVQTGCKSSLHFPVRARDCSLVTQRTNFCSDIFTVQEWNWDLVNFSLLFLIILD